MIYIYRNTLSSFVKTFEDTVKLKPIKATEELSFGGGCDDIVVENVWSKTLPFLMSESASRLIHVNDDGILDVVLGFGTGAYLPVLRWEFCEEGYVAKDHWFGGIRIDVSRADTPSSLFNS